MRRIVLILLIAGVVGFAGCAYVITDDSDGDSADDLSSSGETDDPEETDAGEENDSDATEDPDRDTDDDPPPVDDTDTEIDTPDGALEIHHIDVGQADSTVLVTPEGETILIDTGDWRQSGQEVIDYLEKIGIQRVDYLVATHPHADHIGGHDAVIEWAETEGDGIGTAYDSGIPHTSATYDRYLDAVEKYDVDLRFVEEGDELPIADGAVDGVVLNPPEGDSGRGLHYTSVSISFEFGEVSYLTTGDTERSAEQRMLDHWGTELDADVYHAGHHGSSTSSTQPFLQAVDPETAIISSSFDSQYGHPHDEVLDRFDTMGIETYWTGVHGSVVVTTDGESVTTEPTEEFSSDPADLLTEKQSND